MEEVEREADAAEPEEVRVRERSLEGGGEDDGQGEELDAEGGPLAVVVHACGEDGEADVGEEAGPGGPFPVV